ncbi:MAG: hypothetical protein L0K89_01245, partial [Bifidobacterium crudilactis]|nr:hypothetical protein [Bifidobacterium crudilactis]
SLFYVERGNYQSNLEITTNLNYMPAAHIQKTDIAGDNVQTPAGQSAEFDLYNTAADYDIAGDEATKVGSFSTDEDGAITFVDEQTGAQMNFGRFPTPYFVLKETESPPGYALLLNAIKLEFIPVSQADGTVIPGTGTLNVVNYYETGVETSFDSWATPVNSSISLVPGRKRQPRLQREHLWAMSRGNENGIRPERREAGRHRWGRIESRRGARSGRS